MLKKLKPCVLMLLVVCLCAFSGLALADEFAVVTSTGSLNLRQQPSSTSQWLGSYSRGTWVEVDGSQNNFYYVYTPDGRVGYMSKNYLQLADASNAWMVKVTNANGGAFLNFRSQPNYTSRVLDIFYAGVPLYVNNLTNGWYCVEINGQVGYVRSEYVTDLGRYAPGSSTVATIKTPNNTAMNMRSGPGMNHPVIRQFAGDTYVSVLSKGNDWWYVSVDGVAGFMKCDFLEEGLKTARDLSANKSTTVNTKPYAVVSNPKPTQTLNLRQYASVASQVLDKLYNGEKLWVDEYGSEWCAVTDQVSGISGYVMTRFITVYNQAASTTRLVKHPNGTYVNLRSTPSMNQSNIMARVPAGVKVTVLSPGSDWCKVQYGSMTGYMMTYFLD